MDGQSIGTRGTIGTNGIIDTTGTIGTMGTTIQNLKDTRIQEVEVLLNYTVQNKDLLVKTVTEGK